MFVLYAFLLALAFAGLDLIYIKTFQLEGYKLKKYFEKALHFDFAFGRKTPLVFTNRVKRLIFCDFLLKFIVFLLFFGLVCFLWINLLISILCLLASQFFVILSFLCCEKVEKQIKKSFIKKAKQKLEKCSCKVIAITGSFGKTSTKNILYQILKEEFSVTASPKSFNTPMGVCKTILENLKETDDFLILEFGARHQGDIEELAKMVGVDFGIITPIGGCHLETFGTLQNIENTKYELCDNAKDMVIFNGKSKSTKKLFDRFARKKFLVCEDHSFAYTQNVKVSSSGSQFDLTIDDKQFSCETNLLGKASIDNIVVASAMAYLLGESIFAIQRGIRNLKATAHRLELIKGQFVDVIDDSYNSNFDGFKEALEVLASFEGKKIVVSPGIVELGKSQFETNKKIGEEVAKVVDFFVIMNQTNQKALFEGAKCGGLTENKIFFASTRQEQTKLLKNIMSLQNNQKHVVLFENDLPDNMR